ALSVERNLRGQLLNELRTLGTRPDQAHLTNQDVPQLRHLVEPDSTEKPADRRHAGILLRCPHRTGIAFSIDSHRPEFVDREPTSMLPDANLVVEHGPL